MRIKHLLCAALWLFTLGLVSNAHSEKLDVDLGHMGEPSMGGLPFFGTFYGNIGTDPDRKKTAR